MYILDIIAAFVIAALAGTGVGGGGLFVIYLTLIRGIGQSDAQAINLVFFIAAVMAALPYHMKKRKLNMGVIILCTVLGVMGTYLGGVLRVRLPEDVIRSAFGVMLIATGTYSLLKRKKKESDPYSLRKDRS